MSTENQIELDLTAEEATDIELPDAGSEEDGGREDSFDRAENATQKRIDRLTKKMREAERREQEAINYAKQKQSEADTLKARMDILDSSYVNEYTTRVTTQMTQAEAEYARAMEMGDTQAAVEANRKLTALSIENDRASQAKIQQERAKQQRTQQQAVQPQQAQPQQGPSCPSSLPLPPACRPSTYPSPWSRSGRCRSPQASRTPRR